MPSSILWEQFTGDRLTDLPEVAGPTVDVFDTDRYITGPSRRDARWRVAFNGLGSISYCATVRRTDFLQESIRSDVLGRTREFIGALGKGVLDRTLAWAYLHTLSVCTLPWAAGAGQPARMARQFWEVPRPESAGRCLRVSMRTAHAPLDPRYPVRHAAESPGRCRLVRSA